MTVSDSDRPVTSKLVGFLSHFFGASVGSFLVLFLLSLRSYIRISKTDSHKYDCDCESLIYTYGIYVVQSGRHSYRSHHHATDRILVEQSL